MYPSFENILEITRKGNNDGITLEKNNKAASFTASIEFFVCVNKYIKIVIKIKKYKKRLFFIL